MKNSLRVLPVILALLFMQSNLLAGDTQTINEIPIKPDACIQAQIIRIIPIENEEESLNELSKLKEMDSLERLLQQLFYFQLDASRMYQRKEINKDANMMAGMGANWISCRLLGIADDDDLPITYASAESAINAVLPYLETRNPYFREEILHLELAKVEWVAAHESDYSKYELYIEKRKNNPPLALIEYMYTKSPEDALLSLMRVYMKDPEEKELLALHEEIIRKNIKTEDYTDVIHSLNELSQYKEWWVHLYVAEIMKQCPQIKELDIIQRLKQDEHPLVRKVLNELKDR